MVRTGIDLAPRSVKLVRGEGGSVLERITHIGLAEWNDAPAGKESEGAGNALTGMLSRLGLRRGRLGRLAVSIRGEDAGLREIQLPELSEAELRQALPFEARKHLPLEEMAAPVLGYQVLGPVEEAGEDASQRMRVLLAAAPRSRRDVALRILAAAGLEPEVVDLEPLAQMNALIATAPFGAGPRSAVALLDLGRTQVGLCVTQSRGALLARALGEGLDGSAKPSREVWLAGIAARAHETITFYRGRMRAEVERVFLCGGGALVPGIEHAFGETLGIPVSVLDPFEALLLTESTDPALRASGARFTTACGLCRWWDEAHV
jgi:type IV pilus assembly protein PilM